MQRDRAVNALVQQLVGEVIAVSQADAVVAALAGRGVASPLLAASVPGLRTDRRALGENTITLLFNDSTTPLALQVRKAMSSDAELLDPESGSTTALTADAVIHLPPRRARLLKTGAWSGLWDDAQWREPSMAHRPFVRWWWPGDAVDAAEPRARCRACTPPVSAVWNCRRCTGAEGERLDQEADSVYRVGTPEYFAHVQAVFAPPHRSACAWK